MIKKIYLNLINILIVGIIKILILIKNKIRRIRKIEFEYFSNKYKLYSNKYYFIIFGSTQMEIGVTILSIAILKHRIILMNLSLI